MIQNNPNLDGHEHINLYSRGRTWLGRQLSNFAAVAVKTVDGRFASLEGWWYWQLGQDPQREELRRLTGFAAKKKGKELKIPDWPNPKQMPEFQKKFRQAARAKLAQNPTLARELKNSTLPLTHYYYWGTPPKVVAPKPAEWITQIWEDLRSELKHKNLGLTPPQKNDAS